MADKLGVDPKQIVLDKMEKTAKKYPVDKAKGKYKLLFIPAVDCQNASVEIKQAAETELYDIDLVNASVKDQSQISCNKNLLNNLIFRF